MDIIFCAIGIYIGIGMVCTGILFVLTVIESETFGLADDFMEANTLVKIGWMMLSILSWPYIIRKLLLK